MAIDPECRRHGLAHPVHQENHIFRRIGIRPGLDHPVRMTTVELVGAAPQIGERLHQRVWLARIVPPERRTPAAVHICSRTDGRALDHHVGVGAKFLEFHLSNHALEHVEAVLPVGFQYVGLQPAVGIEPDRAAIREPPGAFLARAEIRGRAVGVLRPGQLRCRGRNLLHRASPVVSPDRLVPTQC